MGTGRVPSMDWDKESEEEKSGPKTEDPEEELSPLDAKMN
jgi:hypothetical protein